MKMSKKIGIVFVAMGAVLVISALLLFLYNALENRQAGQEAESMLKNIQTIILQETPHAENTADADNEDRDHSETTETLSPEMPVIEIDGYAYIGYLSVPDLDLELPIMDDWDDERLKIAPCRHFGSSRTDDLVIAAHNYKKHFGYLSKLQIGSEIYFTDMENIENHYVVVKEPEVLAANDVDTVQNSGFDLVLYTCTPGGATRVAVFCNRISEETDGNGHG